MKKAFCYLLAVFLLLFTGCAHRPDTKQAASVKSAQSTLGGKWEMLSRARYTQGKVVSFKSSADGTFTVSLKVEINYHSTADPFDGKNEPFKTGSIQSFVLRSKPKPDLRSGERVILYQAEVEANGSNRFLGAELKYYEKNSQFLDTAGKKAQLPPKEYPNTI